ncbi:HAMP domain-containing sensor histidine kinase [uncultured Methanoregula sp.]|uniref:HAMP domain-containing sensor histidine kinase n=1 Tax=uncultured Methanoregula sp. TaxID=1005933 RepID=UPI002AABF633|nr:HAMP domain-containing sensor histidine kinase [uncultured Methanoregula sp.]
MQQCDTGGAWWNSLMNPHPIIFVLLILAGLAFEIGVHYFLGITIVYTHFYYLIIVIAGLWFGRKAIWVALFFGGLHIVVSYILTGAIPPDAVVRAIMMFIVAFVIGTIVEQTRCYYNQISEQNRELNDVNEEMRSLNDQLKDSEAAFQTANKKLNLLSSITRHDIKNQLLGLMGFIELSKEKCTDQEMLHFIEREDTAAQAIRRQIEFTKDYEELGVHAPRWQDIGMHLMALRSLFTDGEIEISINVDGLEIFADPLLEKVFENMIDNSRRHGERVRHISFSTMYYDQDSLAIVYEDDGIGVHEAEKDRIFEKGFGKNTGLGLFLSREILAITGLAIKESGIYGKGVRFEILVPKGKFRFMQPVTSPT